MFVHKIFVLETVVNIILKKIILLLFINIGIIIFVSVILRKLFIVIYVRYLFILFVRVFAKFPRNIVPIVPHRRNCIDSALRQISLE